MLKIGTKFSQLGKKALLLGSGELGKEVTIELQRFGLQVVACDRYENAPAMQVADKAVVFNMLDPEALRKVVEQEHPDFIIPEVEAIATPELVKLEEEGYHVTPTARAARLTMNREGIRRLAAEELGIPTSPYRFASTEAEFLAAVEAIGVPCVVKPVMSSSGHGQSVVRSVDKALDSWKIAQQEGRSGAGKVIVEGFIDFDYEITLLTVRAVNGTFTCEPIGHVQINGDYRYSWQPQAMSAAALNKAKEYAVRVTDALGGYGIFGVEMFVKGDDVIFSEVSPRPHDTGMVTMISQDLSEFALHVRALLGFPIPEIRFFGPSASKAIEVEGDSKNVCFSGMEQALAIPGVQMRIFGKPEVKGHRRMGVLLATAETVEKARELNDEAYSHLNITL